MAFELDKAFYRWVVDNPDFTASSALDQLHQICSDYHIDEVTFEEVEYRGIKGGSKRAFGSGTLGVTLLYGSGRDDDTGARGEYAFPFEFEFLLDQGDNIVKAEKLKIDISSFTGEE